MPKSSRRKQEVGRSTFKQRMAGNLEVLSHPPKKKKKKKKKTKEDKK